MSASHALNREILVELILNSRERAESSFPPDLSIPPATMVNQIVDNDLWRSAERPTRTDRLACALSSITPDYRLAHREEIQLYLTARERFVSAPASDLPVEELLSLYPAQDSEEQLAQLDSFEFLELRARRLLLEELENGER